MKNLIIYKIAIMMIAQKKKRKRQKTQIDDEKNASTPRKDMKIKNNKQLKTKDGLVIAHIKTKLDFM